MSLQYLESHNHYGLKQKFKKRKYMLTVALVDGSWRSRGAEKTMLFSINHDSIQVAESAFIIYTSKPEASPTPYSENHTECTIYIFILCPPGLSHT